MYSVSTTLYDSEYMVIDSRGRTVTRYARNGVQENLFNARDKENNVFEKLSSLTYKGKRVAFPVLRLGNQEKVKECICYINQLRREVHGIKVFSSTLDRRKGDRIDRAKQLSGRLKEYEEVLDLTERKETLTQVMEYQERMKNVATLFHFHTDLQGRQLRNLDEKIQ